MEVGLKMAKVKARLVRGEKGPVSFLAFRVFATGAHNGHTGGAEPSPTLEGRVAGVSGQSYKGTGVPSGR